MPRVLRALEIPVVKLIILGAARFVPQPIQVRRVAGEDRHGDNLGTS